MKRIRSFGLMVLAFAVGPCQGADPLDNWTTSNPSVQGGLGSATFGNGQFVWVGASGAVATSPDGLSWTQRNSDATNDLFAITYGNGQFLAVGGQAPIVSVRSATVVSSQDGITWTARDTGTTNLTLESVTYGNGRFVAAGPVGSPLYTAAIISSPDGVNWNAWYWDKSAGNPGGFWVAHGSGQFVAISVGWAATSPDGVNWTQHNYGSGPSVPGNGMGSGIHALAFGNGLFVAVGGGGEGLVGQVPAVIWTSPNGTNWTLRLDYTNGVGNPGFSAVTYGGGQFVASGRDNSLMSAVNTNALIFSSPDGTNWISHEVPLSIPVFSFGNGQFIGLGPNGRVQSGVLGKLGASRSPGGGVSGTVTGETGQNYSIQTSTDLAAWTVLTNVTIVTNGTAQFSDPAATNASRRFYGAVLRQP